MNIIKNINYRSFRFFFILLMVISLISIDTRGYHCGSGADRTLYNFCGGDWSRNLKYKPKFTGYSTLIRPETFLAPSLYKLTNAYDAYNAGFGRFSRANPYWIHFGFVEITRYSQKATFLNLYALPAILRVINIVYLTVLSFFLQFLWHQRWWGKVLIRLLFFVLVISYFLLFLFSIG